MLFSLVKNFFRYQVLDRAFYDLLGLEPNALEEDIKERYRDLALETHPDKNGDAEEFKKIRQAFDVLKDPCKRRIYDVEGIDGITTSEATLSAAWTHFKTVRYYSHDNQFAIRYSCLVAIFIIALVSTNCICHSTNVPYLKELDSLKFSKVINELRPSSWISIFLCTFLDMDITDLDYSAHNIGYASEKYDWKNASLVNDELDTKFLEVFKNNGNSSIDVKHPYEFLRPLHFIEDKRYSKLNTDGNKILRDINIQTPNSKMVSDWNNEKIPGIEKLDELFDKETKEMTLDELNRRVALENYKAARLQTMLNAKLLNQVYLK